MAVFSKLPNNRLKTAANFYARRRIKSSIANRKSKIRQGRRVRARACGRLSKMKLRLFLEEDVHAALAVALRKRGQERGQPCPRVSGMWDMAVRAPIPRGLLALWNAVR